MSASLSAHLLALMILLSIWGGTPARADESAVADMGDDVSAEEREGHGQSCAEWVRRVKLLERFRNKADRPEPSLADVSYGPDRLHTLDIYRPERASSAPLAPILLMVHGGGWCVGDKAAAEVTANKVVRWVSKGFMFVSINYPMVSDGSNALTQAGHVARAMAFVQDHARQWGADPSKLILMGHSAGAHLVSLVNADRELRRAAGARPALGTISLDAGAIDVPMQMPRVYRFLETRYREAFGETREEWLAASPYHRLDTSAAPWLGVCSTRRRDDPCEQARNYANKSLGLGIAAEVLPQSLSHAKINETLGERGAYTRSVEGFMAKLDPGVARLLKRR